MKKKKAFTVAETLITVMIVGILAALLMSTLRENMPDKQQILFTKAFRNLETATADIIKDDSRYDQNANATQSIGFNQDPLSTSKLSISGPSKLSAANAYCYFVAEQMNIANGNINCSSAGKNFQSTNGACYYDLYPFGSEYKDVMIDTACKGKAKDMFAVRIMADGKISIPSQGKSSSNQCKAKYWLLHPETFTKKQNNYRCPPSQHNAHTPQNSGNSGGSSGTSGGNGSSDDQNNNNSGNSGNSGSGSGSGNSGSGNSGSGSGNSGNSDLDLLPDPNKNGIGSGNGGIGSGNGGTGSGNGGTGGGKGGPGNNYGGGALNEGFNESNNGPSSGSNTEPNKDMETFRDSYM